MGNLEKAGIAVVVVLLGVIVVVAFLGNPSDGAGTAAPGTASAQASPGPTKGPEKADPLGPHRSTDNPGAARTVATKSIREIVPSPTRKPPEPDIASGTKEPDAVGKAAGEVAKTPPPAEPPSRPVQPVGGAEASPAPKAGGSERTPPAANGYPKEVKLGEGDSLWKVVGREYGVSLTDAMVKRVIDENGIKDARRLKAGTTLKLPAPPASAANSEEKPASATEPKPAVAEGSKPSSAPRAKKGSDTPAASAKTAVKTATSELLPFEPGPATAGLPTTPKAAAAPAKDEGKTCVVKNGETLVQISRRELGSDKYVKDIAALNQIKDVNRVPAGTKLRLPAVK